MKINAMIRVGKNMHIIILHARKIKFIQQRQRILHVDIVVRNAVHDEEAHVL